MAGGFLYSPVAEEYACNAGDPSSIPGSERSTGEGIGYPLQYSAMREAWVPSLGWEDPLDKGKATHLVFLEFNGLYSPGHS